MKTMIGAGRWIRRHVAILLPVAGGAAFLTLWIVAEAGRDHLWDKIAVFAVFAVFAVLAVAIGLSGWLPIVSLATLVVVPALQFVGVLYPPSATTWPAYEAAGTVALVVGFLAAKRVMRLALLAGFLSSALIALRMTLPSTQEGSWSAWAGWFIGYPIIRIHPLQEDFGGIALVAMGVFVAMLAIGPMYRIWRGGIVRGVLALEAAPHEDAEQTEGQSMDLLSLREREIFLLVSKGLSNAEIAESCFLSEATVKSHVRAILRKLDLRSRGQVVVFAYEHRLQTA